MKVKIAMKDSEARRFLLGGSLVVPPTKGAVSSDGSSSPPATRPLRVQTRFRPQPSSVMARMAARIHG